MPATGRKAVDQAVRRAPFRVRRYAGRTFLALEASIRSAFYDNFAVFPEAVQARLLTRRRPSEVPDPYAEGLACYLAAPGGTLERLGYADLQTYLVELLMKQDQASMAASIESRVPFLDHRFVEYAAALPGRLKVRGWRTKAVLRAALADLVPAPILHRRKMGFPVPLGRWLGGPAEPIIDEFVLGPRAQARGLFERQELRRLVDLQCAGQVSPDRLWLLINLEVWQRIFLDGEEPSAIAELM
jgi:asparagine synthase (glutamine-hydrolysing)